MEDLERLYPRHFSISKSANLFQVEGFHVDVQDGRVIIGEYQARQMADLIEADIRLLGGIEVLRKIFQLIEPNFNTQQERYHLVRKFNNVNHPSIPFNYLLNLCVKYPRKSVPIFVDSFENIWSRIRERSIALASVLDVEPDSQFTLLFHSPDTIAQFLQELAIYDNLFCPTQLRPSDVPKMLEGFFSTYSERIRQKLDYTPKQAATIAGKILDLAKNKLCPMTFRSQDLNIPETQISKDEMDKLLSMYSHSLSNLNVDFKIPQDIAKLSEGYFHSKPLIRTDDDSYLLIAPSICAPAFYEALVSEIREKAVLTNHNELGAEIEKFIKSEFLNRKIKVISGKYGNTKGQKSTNEIDLLIETSKALIFLK
ncbi:MAG: hypothetical protein BJG00_016570 [Limnothrix sp. CACIAM 69d]|nr:MAG: hypothetical protein BJG00_016570 [Limnothrix sp. CACIAM 69d]